jgi:hypothetical protein
MITNEWHDKSEVIASHIWMSKTRGRGLYKFGLTVNELYDCRNGFLVLKDIEDAFDHKQVCFLYNALSNLPQFVLKVLDPNLLPKVIEVSLAKFTFAEIDGFILQHPPKKFPYRRLLGFHAKCSYKNALKNNWISDEDAQGFVEFCNISETASAPDISFDGV